MANPEYEAKINPADLYNDEILESFESIRNVIHKEILPSTYNELIVTSNQAGVFNTEFPFTQYPSTELIFPLSPQSGNVNWLEKNFLRFRLTIKDSNKKTVKLVDFPFDTTKTNISIYQNTIIGIQDPASIFKSVELNYGGTAIWTSAYQQVESLFTFANIPNSFVEGNTQYFTNDKSYLDVLAADIKRSSPYKLVNKKIQDNSGDITDFNQEAYIYTMLVDIDISRLSPILSWMSIIPGFINKLTLRVIMDAPVNYILLKYEDTYENKNITTAHHLPSFMIDKKSTWRRLPSDNSIFYEEVDNKQVFSYSNISWKMELCEIHQCNATMTEDTRIRLISLIQQMGGKWIYPCRYWNTTLAPILSLSKGAKAMSFQFILTGCYFRSISFTTLLNDNRKNIHVSIGNGMSEFPIIETMKIFCDSELIATYNNLTEALTDSDGALVDNDKYNIPKDIIRNIRRILSSSTDFNNLEGTGNWAQGPLRACVNKALGPPNGLYSGRYTSEKMGTHNILIQLTTNGNFQGDIYAWLGALQDGVVVFDNFNGNYFTTARKMQQVYEALT